jgi:hypothetical protein
MTEHAEREQGRERHLDRVHRQHNRDQKNRLSCTHASTFPSLKKLLNLLECDLLIFCALQRSVSDNKHSTHFPS